MSLVHRGRLSQNGPILPSDSLDYFPSRPNTILGIAELTFHPSKPAVSFAANQPVHETDNQAIHKSIWNLVHGDVRFSPGPHMLLVGNAEIRGTIRHVESFQSNAVLLDQPGDLPWR